MRFSGCSRGGPVLASVVLMFAVGVAPQAARANVYAAHLSAPDGWNPETMGSLTLSYRLNTPATSVTIEVFRESEPGVVYKTIFGGVAHGLNTVQWDGTADGGGWVPAASDYRFRVIAEDSVGYTAWTNTTPLEAVNEIGSAQFAAPQGIAINRDPTSQYFGRIYVLNSESSEISFNPGASARGDGIFMLNNDMRFFRGTASLAEAPANVALDTDILSKDSPWRIHLNRANSNELLVGDFADEYENVWLFNGAGTAAYLMLDSTITGPGTGAAQNHGNVIDALITGTGIHRRMWVIDDDYDLNDDIYLSGPDISVYVLGTAMAGYVGQPTEVINGGKVVSGADGNNWTARAFDFGTTSGDLYVVNRRYGQSATELAITRYDVNAAGLATVAVWSRSNPELTADPVVAAAFPGIEWSQTFGVAVDEPRGVGAAGRTDGGEVVVFDTADGSILAAFDSGGAKLRALDFDAAGNLYTTNELDQHVRMWSPPDGPNSYTTTFLGMMNIGPDASPDCNTNGFPDESDISVGTSPDCNFNGVPDECDIATEFSNDLDGNGTPDECDVIPPVIYAAPAQGATFVTITSIDHRATLVKVMVDGTTNGMADPLGEVSVDVSVSPSLLMGKVITARTYAGEHYSVLSAPELVTVGVVTQTLVCDDFEYADQAAFDAEWTPEVDAYQLILSEDQNSTVGGSASAYAPMAATLAEASCSKYLGMTPVLPTSTHPVVWTVDIYDSTAGAAVNKWANLDTDPAQDFFLAEVGLASPYYTGTGEPETHYQGRMIGNGGPNWFHLDQFYAPIRSVGWHRFSVVFKGHRLDESQGHYVDFYVDGLLAAKNQHINEDTLLELPRIGALAWSDAGAYFDEYCVTVGPVPELVLPRDCNTNGVMDQIDIESGTSSDVDSNGVPDECEPDCDTNGVPDAYDILMGSAEDCDTNGAPDSCDIAAGSAADCDTNGVPDSCDLNYGDASDCNLNYVPDSCDLLGGTSTDCDGNDRPDECDQHVGGQVDKLLASDAETYMEFGHSMAVDGDYAVVGVPRSGVGGAAYVLRRYGDEWVEQEILTPAEPQEYDQFGQSVAIHGDYILVGANGDGHAGDSSGAAYLFRRDHGWWIQHARLIADDAEGNDHFGWDVAISDDWAFIAAYLDDGAEINSGSAYVFRNDAGVWTQHQVLRPADAAATDLFGWSVDLDGAHAVVGSLRDDDWGADSGSAYVFVNSNGTWTEQAKLSAGAETAGDYFGYSVAISGPSVVIGANGYDGDGLNQGTVYAFYNSNGVWTSDGQLAADDVANFDAYGASVSMDGVYALIGSRGDDDAGASSGSAYLFRRNGTGWYEQAKLHASDAFDADLFGNTVTMSARDLFISARGDDDAGSFSGSVYAFRVAELDCNSNGTLDTCDIAAEFSADCNHNGAADECELADNDCNANSTPDDCELVGNDCNTNAQPDDCELVGNDCNVNGTPDECELSENDCNSSGVPDECELADNDCNTNSVPDECDLSYGTSEDCNDTGYPDECESVGGGDFDGDGDVDHDDLSHLIDCVCGPGGVPVPSAPICPQMCLDAFNSDADGDIDLADFGAFQESYTGSPG